MRRLRSFEKLSVRRKISLSVSVIFMVIATCVLILAYQCLVASFISCFGVLSRVVHGEALPLYVGSLLVCVIPLYLFTQIRLLFRDPIDRWSDEKELTDDMRAILGGAALVMGVITLEPIFALIGAWVGDIVDALGPIWIMAAIGLFYNVLISFVD